MRSVYLSAFLLSLLCTNAFSANEVFLNKVVDAIYQAEGGEKASVPFGILSVKVKGYSEARQTCLNVVRYRHWQWSVRSEKESLSAKDRGVDFISFLQKTYAPANVKNDPTNLNRHWVKNVSYFMEAK